MKSTKFFTFLFLLTIFFSFSQDLTQTQTLVSAGNMSFTFDRSDKSIRGNPYIIDGFTPARVSADSDKIFNLRYNAVTDEMEVKSNKNNVQAINKNIDSIVITFLKDDKTYQAVNFINKKGFAERGYFVVLNNAQSRIKFLLKESKKFIQRQPARSSYEDTKPAYFKRADDIFYVIIKNKTAQILPEKKKEMIKLFPNHTDAISAYIKKNKIKTSREEDMMKLINYINTL